MLDFLKFIELTQPFDAGLLLVYPLTRRRGGRVAEGDGLLNRYTGLTCIEGSNPSLSAIYYFRVIVLFSPARG